MFLRDNKDCKVKNFILEFEKKIEKSNKPLIDKCDDYVAQVDKLKDTLDTRYNYLLSSREQVQCLLDEEKQLKEQIKLVNENIEALQAKQAKSVTVIEQQPIVNACQIASKQFSNYLDMKVETKNRDDNCFSAYVTFTKSNYLLELVIDRLSRQIRECTVRNPQDPQSVQTVIMGNPPDISSILRKIFN